MDIRGGRPFLCPSGKEELDMSISKFNSEGYHDPTAYDALSSIENEAVHYVLSGQSYIYALPLPETLKRM